MNHIYVNKTSPSADFTTVQEALNSIDSTSNTPTTIHIAPGIYEEKIYIRHEHLHLEGEDPLTTVLSYHQGAETIGPDGKRIGTFNSFSTIVAGSHITAKNLTFQNTSGPGYINGQAVAAFICAKTSSFMNCRFLGDQDTIYAGEMTEEFAGRMHAPEWFHNSNIPMIHSRSVSYYKDCYVEGDVDYIFGPGLAYFEDCHIHTKALQSEDASYITAANTPSDAPYGFIFNHCRITGDQQNGQVYLGRPWRDFAKTLFMNCYIDASIHPAGWHNWDKPMAELTLRYIEIDNHGPGAKVDSRAAFSNQLTGDVYRELLSYSALTGL